MSEATDLTDPSAYLYPEKSRPLKYKEHVLKAALPHLEYDPETGIITGKEVGYYLDETGPYSMGYIGRCSYQVHRLAFLILLQSVNALDGLVVHHNDQKKKNNILSNLAPLTVSGHFRIHQYLRKLAAKNNYWSKKQKDWLKNEILFYENEYYELLAGPVQPEYLPYVDKDSRGNFNPFGQAHHTQFSRIKSLIAQGKLANPETITDLVSIMEKYQKLADESPIYRIANVKWTREKFGDLPKAFQKIIRSFNEPQAKEPATGFDYDANW